MEITTFFQMYASKGEKIILEVCMENGICYKTSLVWKEAEDGYD